MLRSCKSKAFVLLSWTGSVANMRLLCLALPCAWLSLSPCSLRVLRNYRALQCHTRVFAIDISCMCCNEVLHYSAVLQRTAAVCVGATENCCSVRWC